MGTPCLQSYPKQQFVTACQISMSLSYEGIGSCTATFSVFFLERADCNFKKKQDISKCALGWTLSPKD